MTIASILSDLRRGAFEAPPHHPQAQELQKSPGGIELIQCQRRVYGPRLNRQDRLKKNPVT